jgi:hypothetical protein
MPNSGSGCLEGARRVEVVGNLLLREMPTGCFARVEPEERPGEALLFLAGAALFAGFIVCELAGLVEGAFRLGKNQTPASSIKKL